MCCRSKQEFSVEESQMAKIHLKTYSTFLVIREIQIKMTLRYYLIPVRMAKKAHTGDLTGKSKKKQSHPREVEDKK